MTVKNLYEIIRPDGGVTISTTQPDGQYTPYLRLIADEGKVLTNGTLSCPAIDVPVGDESLWTEIDDADADMTPDEIAEAIAEVL